MQTNDTAQLCHLFSKHPELITALCEHYPLNSKLLAQFEAPHLLDWQNLSGNTHLLWTDELIEHYADKWDWWLLSSNESLPWSEALIEKYETKWVWAYCEADPRLMNRRSPLSKPYKSLSANDALPWSDKLLERYAERWDWYALTYSKTLPWSENIIDKYQDHWSIWKGRKLTGNWYDELKWHWEGLSANRHIPWTESLIERHQDKWNWGALSGNDALPWSDELLKKYENKWVFSHLNVRAISSMEALLERYADGKIGMVMKFTFGIGRVIRLCLGMKR